MNTIFKQIFTIVLLFALLSLNAQTRVQSSNQPQQKKRIAQQLLTGYEQLNWEDIEGRASKSFSGTSYPELYTKYVSGDTTLTMNDYRTLYYGYTFQPDYKPLTDNPYKELSIEYFSNNQENMTEDKLFKLIDMTKKALVSEPYNLRALNLLCYCYTQTKDYHNLAIARRNLNGITEAILSSGSGVDKESPMVAIYRDDVASVISLIGGEVRHKMYITTNVEYFHLEEKIEDIKGFYFDISSILKHIPESQKRSQGFEFNPKYNPKSKSFIRNQLK